MYGPHGPRFLDLARQALSSVEGGYDLLAPTFDHTPFRTPEAVAARLVDEALRGHPVRDALDLCCGTGALLEHMLGRVEGQLEGVDLSRAMLAQCRRRLGDAGRSVALTHGDATRLEYREQFDLVVSAGAFGHFTEVDQKSVVDGVFRALRPGGRFVFVTARPAPLGSAAWCRVAAFDAAMRLRNLVWSPRFVMYYASFRWPSIVKLFTRRGFSLRVREGAFSDAWARAVLVSAQRSR